MSNFQNFQTNNTNNVDNNQCNPDMNQGNLAMLNNFMQSLDQTSKGQTNVNNPQLLYTIPVNGYNFHNQVPNNFQNQYFNNMNLLQYNGQQIGFYINNQNQLVSDGYNNVAQQFIPMPNINQGMIQVDVNDMNKNMSQRGTQIRVPKKMYIDDRKPLENGEIEYDNKNRPLIYSCKECPRRFSMNSRLLTHMRCHNGERPHVCHECNFAFTQKSYLVRHAAVHKEERPYQCLACKKTYKHYGSLANHRKTHKNGHKDILNNGIIESKIEPECVIDENSTYQGQQYLFNNHELKEEPQQGFMPTDLSNNHMFSSTDHPSDVFNSLDNQNVFPSSDHQNRFPPTDQSSANFTSTENGQGFLDQLFFSNTSQHDVPESSQPSSNVTSTFTV